MGEDLLRIGELAARAGVSTRTVDYYTGLGLLVPMQRSAGNFRLFSPGDVQRIAAIRRAEAQGIRLEDLGHVLTSSALENHDRCTEATQGPCPADPSALDSFLASLDDQVKALRAQAEALDHETRGVLATLAGRAQALIATALVLSGGASPVGDLLPPL